MSLPFEPLAKSPQLALPANIEHQEIVGAGREGHADGGVLREFEVIGVPWEAQDDTGIACVLFESLQLRQAQSVTVERHNPCELLRGACDTHLCDSRVRERHFGRASGR